MAEQRRLGACVFAEHVVWHLEYQRGLTDPVAIERVALLATGIVIMRTRAAIAAHRRPMPVRRRPSQSSKILQLELQFLDSPHAV
ncbi:hypothetical protein FHR71_002270 [Methylobacterium sp. RAS18]|nr:hypothetical protein [Methylobacterium sp. RAS18]